MPFSQARSRPRIPLLRSLSANAAASDSDVSATSSQDDQHGKSGNGRQRSSGGWSLPTLSTFNFHRRKRTKSEAKRKSLEGKAGRRGSGSRERRGPVSPKVSPRGQSPNKTPRPAAPATTGADPSSPVEPEASHSLHQTAPTTTPELTFNIAADSNSSKPDSTILFTTAPTTNSSGLRPTTPAKSKPECPLVFVQRPSTPTVPTLEAGPCVQYDIVDDVMHRKVWVKRAGASATRVEVAEDDLVDNVRDVILHKYANSLGKSIDSPDIVLKILSREQNNKNVSAERPLGPEEPIGSTLDAYYPGGQTVDEALIIDVPQRRTTPRVSPRAGNHHIYYYPEQYRPDEAAREYFPPMQVHSPHLAHVPHPGSVSHSMAVLTTGQLPPLPSPGSHGQRRHVRPKYGRQHTSSPTILHTVQPNGQVIESKSQMNGPSPSAPPLPTPPAQGPNEHNPSITPPNRVSSPHPGQKPKRRKGPAGARSTNGDPQAPPKSLPAASSLLDGTVPPINVLLVEDNVINLKLLEAFMKRLKVRWKSAMNGKEAVSMWRQGGFHLVLMDIQLPVMNGLEATKEIRRLEAVNGIGVFSGSPIEPTLKPLIKNGGPLGVEDTLPDRSQFKSPVIIVALTASSLQSDRHEALAAGCNDFLTKPVNFVWMERKVTEWGCMQALIDFDGWRKWKQYAADKAAEDPAKKAAEEKEEKAKQKAALKAMFSRPPPTTKKDKDSTSPGATTTVERTTTPVQNGTPKKGPGPGAGSSARSHKSSRSTASGAGGNLESMAEEDENSKS
ncbi:Two-component response regulator SSK1p [Cladophialophora chaetospira]|uniref:Two-component response regulator SSK1p n=1 Tax=Cladophialophora chaetospira TaxID=386627 RepID=A0AA38XFG5_9EURO|nr:Two-component response regulator SSK1p [Cladophialophora chaetospira]